MFFVLGWVFVFQLCVLRVVAIGRKLDFKKIRVDIFHRSISEAFLLFLDFHSDLRLNNHWLFAPNQQPHPSSWKRQPYAYFMIWGSNAFDYIERKYSSKTSSNHRIHKVKGGCPSFVPIDFYHVFEHDVNELAQMEAVAVVKETNDASCKVFERGGILREVCRRKSTT